MFPEHSCIGVLWNFKNHMFGRPFLIRMFVRKQEASARVPGSSVHCNPTALKFTCGVVRRLPVIRNITFLITLREPPKHFALTYLACIPVCWTLWQKQSSLNLCQVENDLCSTVSSGKKGVQPPWRVLVLDAAHAPNHQNTIVGSQQWHPLTVLLPPLLRPVCLSLQD